MDSIPSPHDTFFRERHLPPVYPLVIYHGNRPWTAPTGFQGLVRPLPEPMKPFVPSFGYQLVDLSGPSDAEIKGRVLTRLVQLAMRWVFDAEPVERLIELLVLIEQIEDRDTAVEVLESLLRYFVQGIQRVDEPTVRALLQQTSNGDPIMPRLTEDALMQRDAERDLNAELLDAIDDLQAGRVSRMTIVRDGQAVESRITRARPAAKLCRARFASLLGSSKRTLQD
jgi:DNA-binding transcriptional regulator YiaG